MVDDERQKVKAQLETDIRLLKHNIADAEATLSGFQRGSDSYRRRDVEIEGLRKHLRSLEDEARRL